jgi:hypothetical protein
MTQPDSVQRVKFDLGRGLVSLDEASYRVLVPPDVLAELLTRAGPKATKDFGHRIGDEVGRRVAERLGTATLTVSVEGMLGQLATDIALFGLGLIGMERWGRALVITVEDSPLGPKGDEFSASVFEGAIERALGRQTGVVVLARDSGLVRLLVVSPTTAGRVRQWVSAGTPWSEAITRLHAPATSLGGAR